MSLTKDEIEEKIEQGAIHCLVVLEIAGKPKEHVEKSLEEYIAMLEKEEAVTMLNIDKHEAAELEGENEGFFSAFAELEMIVPQAQSLVSLAVNLTPASIEILAPDEFHFTALDFQNWTNDVLSQAHTIAQSYREVRQQNAYLNKNLMSLTQNMMQVLLASGAKSSADLAKLSGLKEEAVAKVLGQMQENSLVEEVDGTWKRLKKE